MKTERQMHVITPETTDPDKLLPDLLQFFAKLVGAKHEFDLDKLPSEVLLSAMTSGFANLLHDNGMLPKEILDHLDSISVGGEIHKPTMTPADDPECDGCLAQDTCDGSHLKDDDDEDIPFLHFNSAIH